MNNVGKYYQYLRCFNTDQSFFGNACYIFGDLTPLLKLPMGELYNVCIIV